jgi:hypothetical protein
MEPTDQPGVPGVNAKRYTAVFVSGQGSSWSGVETTITLQASNPDDIEVVGAPDGVKVEKSGIKIPGMDQPKGGGLSGGAIAGIVIGVVVFAGLVTGLVVFLVIRNKRKKKAGADADEGAAQP